MPLTALCFLPAKAVLILRLFTTTGHKGARPRSRYPLKTALLVKIAHIVPCIRQRLSGAIELLDQGFHHGKLREVALV